MLEGMQRRGVIEESGKLWSFPSFYSGRTGPSISMWTIGNWRIMETVLTGLTYKTCLVNLNDVTVIGRTFQEHSINLRKVFRWFRKDRLKLNPEKCQPFQK